MANTQMVVRQNQLFQTGALVQTGDNSMNYQRYVFSLDLCMLQDHKNNMIRKGILQPAAQLTRMVLKSPSRKFLKGVRKLMAALWINSRSAPPICFSVSPHFIRAFPGRFNNKSTNVSLFPIQPWADYCTTRHRSLNQGLTPGVPNS